MARRRAFPGKGGKPRSTGEIPPGLVTMANQSLTEGDSGSANMTFTVLLGSAQDRIVSFDYATADATGTAGVDYTAVSGSKTIAIGSTSTTIDVPILGDTTDESDETFTLRLSNIRYL
jgi:fibronectin-binding autotransporter adhesin